MDMLGPIEDIEVGEGCLVFAEQGRDRDSLRPAILVQGTDDDLVQDES
jgi:hypothetical protein